MARLQTSRTWCPAGGAARAQHRLALEQELAEVCAACCQHGGGGPSSRLARAGAISGTGASTNTSTGTAVSGTPSSQSATNSALNGPRVSTELRDDCTEACLDTLALCEQELAVEAV
jgi:hypothetical protein